jgi:hypothetical protein
MTVPIVVHLGRTNVITASLGFDVSGDTITSQIRAGNSRTDALLATWVVTYLTDGVDGEIVLTLDDSALATVDVFTGFMDIKRLSAGEPLTVLPEPLRVMFKEVVTA